jgi:hypothetical protein
MTADQIVSLKKQKNKKTKKQKTKKRLCLFDPIIKKVDQ